MPVSVPRFRSWRARAGLYFLMAAVVVAGCTSSSDEGGGGGPSTLFFVGVIGSSSGVGSGAINVQFLDDYSGGSFKIGPNTTNFATVQVVGTQFDATGGGYTFTGNLTGTDLVGSYTTTGDAGLFSVLFVPPPAGGSRVCGSHIGTLASGQPVGGVFAFVTLGNVIHGVVTSAGPTSFVSTLSGTTANVVLDDVGGTGTVNVAGGAFDGTYTTGGGDAGTVGGHNCGSSGPSFQDVAGIFGSSDGGNSGAFGLDLGSSSETSSGTYDSAGVIIDFDAVILAEPNKIVAFKDNNIFSGTFSGSGPRVLDGIWYNGATPNGLIAGIDDPVPGQITPYCGNHTGPGGGVFGFLLLNGGGLRGIYTGGVGGAFQGTIGGTVSPGAATMSSETGTATVVIDVGGTFSGFFDFAGTGGPSGNLAGPLCP